VYASSTSALATGSALTFDGSNFGGSVNVLVSDNKAIGFGSNAYWLGNSASGFIAGYTNGTERMRLTSAGYLGIGTSSPSRLLHVQATGTGNVATFQSNAGPNVAFVGTESSGRTYLIGEGIVNNGNFSVYDSTASAERLVVDSSGNLGLGVTPSAWSGAKGFDIGNRTAVYENSGNAASGITNNLYIGSGGYTYKTTAAGSALQQVNGTFYWYNTPSGTGGTVATLNQAMTLDNSGNLLVGTTSIGNATSGSSVKFGTSGKGTQASTTNASVANSGTSTIAIDTSGASYMCFLLVSNINNSNANLATRTAYVVLGRGTTATFTSLATQNGTTGGASFTIAMPSNGLITVTNTSGSTTTIVLTAYGQYAE
jgi:hypothetical protein